GGATPRRSPRTPWPRVPRARRGLRRSPHGASGGPSTRCRLGMPYAAPLVVRHPLLLLSHLWVSVDLLCRRTGAPGGPTSNRTALTHPMDRQVVRRDNVAAFRERS